MKKHLFISSLSFFILLQINAQNTAPFPVSGNVGIGTISPNTALTIQGASSTEFEGTDNANGGVHHLELIGTSSGKALLQGPTITFKSPANTNGSNNWAMARLMGAPASTSTSNALGAFHIQVRDSYNPGVGGYWNWRTGLSIINNGNVGIGTTSPSYLLQINNSDNPTLAIGKINTNTNGKSTLQFYASTASNGNGFAISYLKNLATSTDRLGFFDGGNVERLSISNGNVGIGTIIPDSKLTVAGNIHAQEVKVTVNAGADFVFNDDYKLPSLKEVEQFIKTNNHLPEIASEKEMQDNGLLLAKMNIKLLQKIEELTLYTIQQQKLIEAQTEAIESQSKLIKEIQQKLKS